MLFLMSFAAVVSIVQLAVLGSWGRSLRIVTLLQGIAVGFVVTGMATLLVQLGWTRLFAAISGMAVYDVQSVAAWTVDPFIEEIFKVAPLVWLMWRRPRVYRQLGWTDSLLYGAALGMGFELLESALRYTSVGMLSMGGDGGWVVDGGFFGAVTVPSIWTSLTSWQPGPSINEDWFGGGNEGIQHMVWTALAAVGIAWLAKVSGPLRALGLLPLLGVSLDHANFNYRIYTLDGPGWISDVLAWMGAQLGWQLMLILAAAVTMDRLVQARGRRLSPGILLPGEGPTGLRPGPVLAAAFSGPPLSLITVWGAVLSRRAAITSFVAGEQTPQLRDSAAAGIGRIAAVMALPAPQRAVVWRQAWANVVKLPALRQFLNVRTVLWVVCLLPAFLYTVVGAFPGTAVIQDIFETTVGLIVMLAGAVAATVLGVTQVPSLVRGLKELPEPALHERRIEPLARLASIGASTVGMALIVVAALLTRSGSASLGTFHLLDAIGSALVLLGFALLIFAIFAAFPPAGLAVAGVGVVGGGAAAVSVSGIIASGLAATALGAIVLMMDGPGGGGGGSSSGGPPRFQDNTSASRTYGSSKKDILAQAQKYAETMRSRGNTAEVPPIRYGKYGENTWDYTVVVRDRSGAIKHIRHFIYRQK